MCFKQFFFIKKKHLGEEEKGLTPVQPCPGQFLSLGSGVTPKVPGG